MEKSIMTEDTCKEKQKTASKVKFWAQDGFRRGLGGSFLLIGGILTMFPKTNILGQALFCVGSTIFGAGMIKAAQKSDLAINGDIGLFQTVVNEGKKIVAVIEKKR
jgi:hypothetical protein